MKTFTAIVRSGKGEFAYWLERLSPVYQSKLGIRLFPGTLNADIGVDYSLPRSGIIRISSEETAPYGGTVNVSIARCRINKLDAFILRTDANENGAGDHPRSVVEIASQFRLRERFMLHDGSSVELELP